jgi:hypothetical protein
MEAVAADLFRGVSACSARLLKAGCQHTPGYKKK